jgi:tRNA modification GTPase
VAAILQSLAVQGVLTTSAEEFAPAVAENLLATEAWLALAQARTERTATHLLAQLQGALAEACDLIQQAIHQQEQNRAVTLCGALLSRAALGRHLTEPWRVVLAGEPNVGKSSLMNALMGYSRSIVFAEPGTTRDVVSALTAFAGWPIELLDTAGLRETSDVIESAGVKLAEAQLAMADLILLVTDASAAWSAENAAICANYEHVLVVLNKSDLLRDPAASKVALSGRETCLVSALSGNGLEELGDRIAKRLVPEQPEPGAAIPFTARQTQLLALAHSALQCGDWPQAREVFTKLIGG